MAAAAIFIVALPTTAVDLQWLTGKWSGIVVEHESKSPIPGALVAGVWGDVTSSWMVGSAYHCRQIEVTTADAKGEFRFSGEKRPDYAIAFKEGFWLPPVAATMYLALARTELRSPPDPPVPGFETPLVRRLNTFVSLVDVVCRYMGKDLRRSYEPFFSAIVRDGAKSAATQGERMYVLQQCRLAARDGDDDGRELGMPPRAAFTGLEAKRLRERAPECLAPAMLAAKVNEGAAPNSPRLPISVDDPHFLSVAIVDDPAAEAKRRSDLNVTGTSCRHDPDPEALVCCVSPSTAGGKEAVRLMQDYVKEAGIPHAPDKFGNSVCVRRNDQAIATQAASKANAVIRDRP